MSKSSSSSKMKIGDAGLYSVSAAGDAFHAMAGDVTIQAVVATFSPSSGILSVFGDSLDNSITLSRNAAGNLLVNGGAVAVRGPAPTVANTSLIQVFGQGGNDVITLDETNGALPRANLFGGAGNDTLTGGSGADMLFGQSDNDVLLGKGGTDFTDVKAGGVCTKLFGCGKLPGLNPAPDCDLRNPQPGR